MNLRENRIIRSIAFIIAIFVISRVGIYTVSYFGYNLFSKYHIQPKYTVPEGSGRPKMQLPEFIKDTQFPTLDNFVKFDSHFYVRMAEKGYDKYRMDQKHPYANWPFFPLYPLLMSLLHFIIPIKMSYIGFILSNLFGIMGLYFVYRIAQEVTGDKGIAQKSVIYLLLYPASIYLSIVYTESLFIFLSALSMYLLIKKRLGWAILVASISTVTRIPGIANLVIIAFYLFKEARFNPLKIHIKHYVYLLLSGIPLLSFFTYMYFLTGDFFAVFNELKNWGRTASMPFMAYLGYLFYPTFVGCGGWDLGLASYIFTLLAFCVYTAFLVYMLVNRKKPQLFGVELLVYGLILILIPLSSASTSMTSMVRYYMASFPLFIFMGILGSKNRVVEFLFTILLFSFNVIYTISYVNNYYFVV
ncbi:MAG: hypothetical protein N3B21_03005 [Clostridia bacterium]|nr:hypothetical protein [Clostridia bacterium]